MRAAHPELALKSIALVYEDLFDPAGLNKLDGEFLQYLERRDRVLYALYMHWRNEGLLGENLADVAHSDVLVRVAPHVSAFVARLFGIESEADAYKREVHARDVLWAFRRGFVKKVMAKLAAECTELPDVYTRIALGVVHELGGTAPDNERRVATAVLRVLAADDTARKAAKGGGAAWDDDLRSDIDACVRAAALNGAEATDKGRGTSAARFLSCLAAWVCSARDCGELADWMSLKEPRSYAGGELVHLRKRDSALGELVGLPEHIRERDGFALSDTRGSRERIEYEADYCMYCHERDKDSCAKGFRAKEGGYKKNALGVDLEGCPLGEKIGEMHVLRKDGDCIGALALITVDNPMCAGTGHRICNDCMKACIFQKQEPVNIPEVETASLTDVLSLPWGVEIYGLLTRWNPLNLKRPVPLPYNGKKALVVGLGPAGYTLAHHLSRDGFAVVAIDGLKLEPLPEAIVGTVAAPKPVRNWAALCEPLESRVVGGFGGVSEYGITVRWDKNFLGLLHLNVSRDPGVRLHGGVRFGGTVTIEDAWRLGFDHIAIAAGAGKPTLINMPNGLARGVRQASDFLMSLQLSGAFKADSLVNLQVELPAVVIGGGLTAIDTATELLAYYPVQVERTLVRVEALLASAGELAVWGGMDAEERRVTETHIAHARALRAERDLAARDERAPRIQDLLQLWGGVTLAYRRKLVESPAYRLNHEEVEKSLEEGVCYLEEVSPLEVLVDGDGHASALRVRRKDGTELDLPARAVCIAAGTRPNVTYAREWSGSLSMDARGQYFLSHVATLSDAGKVQLAPSSEPGAFFSSYVDDAGRTISFYGDNHPRYAGSVVRAMASAKDGAPYVSALFDVKNAGDPAEAGRFFDIVHDAFSARVVSVQRLAKGIVELVVYAPLAARNFQPGQFYRLQNFERVAPVWDGQPMVSEGLALTGAWTDPDKGLLGMIVLEMGGSADLVAHLQPGEPVVVMGPTGAPTVIPSGETVLLCGGGLGNAVLFSIARALKAAGSKVVYFAGYKNGEDLFKREEVEASTDQVIWATDAGAEIVPSRSGDVHVRGNIVQAMVQYARNELGVAGVPLHSVSRLIAIGSDRMMAAVKEARHGVLAPYLSKKHLAIGSINSPMQCMMKEICAQCLQRHTDPVTGAESFVFSCSDQDQDLDRVDFSFLRQRLRANSAQEKLTALWIAEKRRAAGVERTTLS